MNFNRLTIVGMILYFGGYIALRSMATEVWDKDGRTYVIFPEDPIMLYNLYRPLSIIDEKLTGMGAHIGPHETDS